METIITAIFLIGLGALAALGFIAVVLVLHHINKKVDQKLFGRFFRP